MAGELDPGEVTARLAALRSQVGEPFERVAARRLAELRALFELARHLQQR